MFCQALAKLASANLPTMDEHARRVSALQLLKRERFGDRLVNLATALHKSPSQVSQWLSGVRKMREDSAREIEAKLRLPRGWMDQEIPLEGSLTVGEPSAAPAEPPLLSELEQAAIHALRGLSQEQRAEKVAELVELRQANERLVAQLTGKTLDDDGASTTYFQKPLPRVTWKFQGRPSEDPQVKNDPEAKDGNPQKRGVA